MANRSEKQFSTTRRGVSKFVVKLESKRKQTKERREALWKIAAFSDDVDELEKCLIDKHTKEVDKALIDACASNSHPDFGSWGPTPIICALAHKRVRMAIRLHEFGADAFKADRRGDTGFLWACRLFRAVTAKIS